MNGMKEILKQHVRNLSEDDRLSFVKFAVKLVCDYFEKSSNGETVFKNAVRQFLFPSVFDYFY